MNLLFQLLRLAGVFIAGQRNPSLGFTLHVPYHPMR